MFCGEWRLHTQAVQLIWSQFSKAKEIFLLCRSPPHYPLWYSLTGALLSMDALAQICISPSESDHTYAVQGQKDTRSRRLGLTHLDLVLGAHAPLHSPSLVTSPEEGPSFSGAGHNMVPTAAHHDTVNGKSLKKHNQNIRFLRGTKRLNITSCDLSLVLQALQRAPFEPLESVA